MRILQILMTTTLFIHSFTFKVVSSALEFLFCSGVKRLYNKFPLTVFVTKIGCEALVKGNIVPSLNSTVFIFDIHKDRQTHGH